MSERDPENSSSPATQPAKPAAVAPPPVARSARRTPEQIVAPTPSTDAFATPSETSQPEAQVLAGPEPAIFGGVNPLNAPAQQLPTPPEIPEEDEVTAGPIIRPNPRNILRFIRQSNTVLLVLLTLSLTFGTWAVIESIPAESYVSVTVSMRSPAPPSPEEAAAQQAEYNSILRTYPLRAAARNILAKDAPNLTPGFLDSMMFTGSDAITWDESGDLTLRVNTTRPAEDSPRLLAVASALLQMSDARQRGYEEHAAKLQNYRVHLRELKRQQSELEQDAARSPETRPADQSSFARTLAQRIESTNEDIAREQRILDTWIMADRIDPDGVQSYDNRPFLRNMLLATWAILLTLFGVPIGLNLAKRRRSQRARRLKQGSVITRQLKGK